MLRTFEVPPGWPACIALTRTKFIIYFSILFSSRIEYWVQVTVQQGDRVRVNRCRKAEQGRTTVSYIFGSAHIVRFGLAV